VHLGRLGSGSEAEGRAGCALWWGRLGREEGKRAILRGLWAAEAEGEARLGVVGKPHALPRRVVVCAVVECWGGDTLAATAGAMRALEVTLRPLPVVASGLALPRRDTTPRPAAGRGRWALRTTACSHARAGANGWAEVHPGHVEKDQSRLGPLRRSTRLDASGGFSAIDASSASELASCGQYVARGRSLLTSFT
jgi:hypothetical protein